MYRFAPAIYQLEDLDPTTPYGRQKAKHFGTFYYRFRDVEEVWGPSCECYFPEGLVVYDTNSLKTTEISRLHHEKLAYELQKTSQLGLYQTSISYVSAKLLERYCYLRKDYITYGDINFIIDIIPKIAVAETLIFYQVKNIQKSPGKKGPQVPRFWSLYAQIMHRRLQELLAPMSEVNFDNILSDLSNY